MKEMRSFTVPVDIKYKVVGMYPPGVRVTAKIHIKSILFYAKEESVFAKYDMEFPNQERPVTDMEAMIGWYTSPEYIFRIYMRGCPFGFVDISDEVNEIKSRYAKRLKDPRFDVI